MTRLYYYLFIIHLEQKGQLATYNVIEKHKSTTVH